MYVQVVHLLHTMFTPDSIELFLLNPEVHDLEFLGEAQKSAKSAPRMADEPWTKMHMMHLDRFEKIFMSWYLRDKTRPASKIDVGASIQNMTPEDIFALRSCLGRWQRHWDPAAQDSEAHEKWAFEHFRESLLDTYERDSVMSYLDNADPDMPVLQPKNVSKDQGQTVAQDHVAKMAQLEEETWFRAWKDNTAFLLLYTGLKHRNASDPKLKWGNMCVAMQTAILDAEWRRQHYGGIWARGSLVQEKLHFEHMHEDLQHALDNLRSVTDLLEEARVGVPTRSLPDIRSISSWNGRLAGYLVEFLPGLKGPSPTGPRIDLLGFPPIRQNQKQDHTVEETGACNGSTAPGSYLPLNDAVFAEHVANGNGHQGYGSF